MDLNKFIVEVHKNAVDHGRWDEAMDFDTVVALIHSEWSEALKESRAGRRMVWREGDKPKGIAVELIDGCLRILDYIGAFADNRPGITIFAEDVDTIDKILQGGIEVYMDAAHLKPKEMKIECVVCTLHMYASRAWMEQDGDWLFNAMLLALCWVHEQGLDPEAIMMDKYRYNETRPYRHGDKKI